jgi:hypothetical protein
MTPSVPDLSKIHFFNQLPNAALTSLIPPLFIEVPVPSQENERSSICVLYRFFAFFYLFSLIDVETVPTGLHFFVCQFITNFRF